MCEWLKPLLSRPRSLRRYRFCRLSSLLPDKHKHWLPRSSSSSRGVSYRVAHHGPTQPLCLPRRSRKRPSIYQTASTRSHRRLCNLLLCRTSRRSIKHKERAGFHRYRCLKLSTFECKAPQALRACPLRALPPNNRIKRSCSRSCSTWRLPVNNQHRTRSEQPIKR